MGLADSNKREDILPFPKGYPDGVPRTPHRIQSKESSSRTLLLSLRTPNKSCTRTIPSTPSPVPGLLWFVLCRRVGLRCPVRPLTIRSLKQDWVCSLEPKVWGRDQQITDCRSYWVYETDRPTYHPFLRVLREFVLVSTLGNPRNNTIFSGFLDPSRPYHRRCRDQFTVLPFGESCHGSRLLRTVHTVRSRITTTLIIIMLTVGRSGRRSPLDMIPGVGSSTVSFGGAPI